MTKCNECNRKFPDGLVSNMLTYRYVCPICGLKISNEIHGINRTDFDGPIAQQMLFDAREFVSKGNA